MSLKDEIEKIIKTEQHNLLRRKQKDSEFRERQRTRFGPLASLLLQLVDSIEPAYIRLQIQDDSATLEVGRERDGQFSAQIYWSIQPNSGMRISALPGEGFFQEEPGFRVEETVIYEYPELDASEKTQVFPDETAVAEYLVGKAAKKVAFYRHLASLGQRRDTS